MIINKNIRMGVWVCIPIYSDLTPKLICAKLLPLIIHGLWKENWHTRILYMWTSRKLKFTFCLNYVFFYIALTGPASSKIKMLKIRCISGHIFHFFIIIVLYKCSPSPSSTNHIASFMTDIEQITNNSYFVTIGELHVCSNTILHLNIRV